MRHFLATATLLLFSLGGLGQSKQNAATTAKDFPDEAAVIEQLSTIQDVQDSGALTETFTARVRVQSEAGVRENGVLITAYEGDRGEATFLFVRVIKPDGTVIETPVNQTQDVASEISRAAPFYTSMREKHLAVQSLGVGDVLEYSLRTTINKPLAPGHYWQNFDFADDSIILDQSLTVRVPASRKLTVKSPEHPPQISEKDGKRIYSWKWSNTRHLSDEEKSKLQSLETPPPPDIQITTFSSWKEFAAWYSSIQKERAGPSPEVKAKAAELTKDAKSDEQKVKALYNYVSQRFRYIGIALGIGAYQPHFANEVLHNQYGDCKDKHTLFSALLSAAGIKSYPVLISSGRTLDEDVPSPVQFDHMISLVEYDGKRVWMDSTPEITAAGYLFPQLRDKKALIIHDDGSAEIAKTPAAPPFVNVQTFEIASHVTPEGSFAGKVVVSSRGDSEILMRTAFRVSSTSKWTDVAQALSQLMGYSGRVSNVVVGSIDDTSTPFELKYDYLRKELPDWKERRMVSPLPYVPLPRFTGEEKVQAAISLGAPGELSFHGTVEFPPGSQPTAPQDVDLKSKFADYSATYKFVHGALEVTRQLLIKQKRVSMDQLAEYKKFVKAVSDDENTYIYFDRSAAFLPDGLGTPEVQALLSQGRLAFAQKKWVDAAARFKSAAELDPSQDIAWVSQAQALKMAGKTEDAVAVLRQRVEKQPKVVKAYRELASFLQFLKRDAEVDAVWNALLKTVPEDAEANYYIGTHMLSRKRYTEAIEKFEVALKVRPDTPSVISQMGIAYLANGQNDKAQPLLDRAVELDPEQKNGIAYSLSELGLDLDRAETLSLEAITAIEADSTNIDVASVTDADLLRVSNLAANWDTLGWIYYKKGDLDSAIRYLQAASELSQFPVIADHLGDAYLKKGNRQAAAKAYANSLAMKGDATEVSAKLAKIVPAEERGRIVYDAVLALSNDRSFRLPVSPTQKGTAEYYVVFSHSPEKTEAHFISGQVNNLTASLVRHAVAPRFPDHVPTKILRRVIVFCSPGGRSCDVALIPVNAVPPTEVGTREW